MMKPWRCRCKRASNRSLDFRLAQAEKQLARCHQWGQKNVAVWCHLPRHQRTNNRKYTNIYIYIYVYIHVHICTYTNIYSIYCTIIYKKKYIYIYTYLHIHVYIYTYISIYVFIYIYIHMYIYIYIHVHLEKILFNKSSHKYQFNI